MVTEDSDTVMYFLTLHTNPMVVKVKKISLRARSYIVGGH